MQKKPRLNNGGCQEIKQHTQNVIDGVYTSSDQDNDELPLDKTIFHALLESDLPAEEKLHSRLWQEGQVVIGAGADTTANALTITHFHILDKPDIYDKLLAELQEALPNSSEPVQLRVVEKLPYLVSFFLSFLSLSFFSFSFFRFFFLSFFFIIFIIFLGTTPIEYINKGLLANQGGFFFLLAECNNH